MWFDLLFAEFNIDGLLNAHHKWDWSNQIIKIDDVLIVDSIDSNSRTHSLY